MEKAIRLVIFDLDGTLVDAYQAVASSLNFALGQAGFDPIDDETIKRSVGWGERKLISKFIPASETEKVISIYREHHRNALHSGTKFLPGAKVLIKGLKKQGYKLAIATNRPSRFTHIILKHLHAAGSFDYVVCADNVEHPKPEKDMLVNILKKFSLMPEEALYVGDMGIDVQAGQNAGVRTVAVVSGSNTRQELESFNADWIIERISEVEGIVKQANFSQGPRHVNSQ